MECNLSFYEILDKLLMLCYSMSMATKPIQQPNKDSSPNTHMGSDRNSLRLSRIARGVGHGISTAIFNLTTLRSERAFILAEEQITKPVVDTRSVDERIRDYLDAPMTEDGTHPDPLAPQFNLFGE